MARLMASPTPSTADAGGTGSRFRRERFGEFTAST